MANKAAHLELVEDARSGLTGREINFARSGGRSET
jgi:hypothetical protein